MITFNPDLLSTLSPENRALWAAFAGHNEPAWSRVVQGHEGDGYHGFNLLIDGEAQLCLSFWEDEGATGVVDEFYVHAFGGEGHFSNKPLPDALNSVADEVAGSIAANDPDGYRPDDVHPLIREEVTRLLTYEYTTGVW